MRPVIIGYGHAGRDLHHRSLRALAERGAVPGGEVIVVDPNQPRDLPSDTRWVPSLSAVQDIADSMFHVTTPVDQHLSVTTNLVMAGARHVILEKPITSTAREAVMLRRLSTGGLTHIDAISVWPASLVTARVVELLAAGRIGALVALHMEQSKPRFRRNLLDRAHRSAFQIELPHQVLLALHLAGPADHVSDVRSWPSPVDGSDGGARLSLRHRNGVVSTLVSDLTSPVRIRRLRLTGTTGQIVADFPVSADDDFGQIRVSGQPGREVVADQPLTRFIEQAYAHAAGVGPPPPAPLDLHVSVIELLEQAMSMTTLVEAVPC